MTTPEAAARYYAEYLRSVAGKKYAIYNPHNKPLEELPNIYGFNNGESSEFWNGVLMAEDGVELGQHLCSNEGYMLGDLGILEGCHDDRHEEFKKHYPEGYKMDFVSYKDVRNNEGLMAAIALAESKKSAA